MKAFQAYASGGYSLTANTPRAAATMFFAQYPNKRKCNVIAGETDGGFFTVRFGRVSPQSWKGVTYKSAGELPHEVSA